MTTDEFYAPVRCEVQQPIDPHIERWLIEFLDKGKWYLYLEFNMENHRLQAYAVPAGEIDDFRFWLTLALLHTTEDV